MKSLYVTATGQNKGKTSFNLGLLSILQEDIADVGFIKPLGQRFVMRDGLKIEEDVDLMYEIHDFPDSIRDMSPLIIDKGFTRQHIGGKNAPQLTLQVMEAYNRIANNHALTVIEGSGNCSVGSVFGLCNMRVAQETGSPVVLITEGGIGNTVDHCSLNLAYMRQFDVRVLGVVINKVITRKYDEIADVTVRGINAIGLDVLGVVPYEPILTRPRLGYLLDHLKVRILAGADDAQTRTRIIQKTVIGAMKPNRMLQYLQGGELLITGGDREDVLIAILGWSAMSRQEDEGSSVAGIIITGGVMPQDTLLKMADKLGITVALVDDDTFSVAKKVSDLTVKTQPGDVEKIQALGKMVRKYVDVDRILNAL